MSMNLHCNRIELQQTPTHITYMCMVQPNGQISPVVTGQKAKHALQIYIQWLQGKTDGIFHSTEDLERVRKFMNEEIESIEILLKSSSKKELKVYIS